MPVSSSIAGQSIASLISGQVSGIDVPATVDGLLAIKKFEISQLQNRQDEATARQAALLKINDSVNTFRTTANSMASSKTFFDYTASLSSSSSTVTASSLLDVSGTSGLASGQHDIVISKVAQAERLSSSSAVKDNAGSALSSASSALNISGSFQVAGVTISVNTSDSLNAIAANINQLNTGASATGVNASVIKVGNNDFRLILASDTTGASGFSLTGASLSTGGSLVNLQLGSLASASAVQTSGAANVTDKTTALGSTGTFQINGSNVLVAATDSLQDVANTINNSITGVTARIDTIGSSDFRLVLMEDAANPLANKTITVSDPNAVLGAGQALAGLQLTAASQSNVTSSLVQAQDAQFSIDGLTLTRSSNTITDALSGVTLNLKQADPATTVKMAISVDQQSLRSKVQSFVDNYNSLQTLINDQFKFDPNTGVGGILAGDPVLKSLQSTMANSLFKTIPGVTSDKNSLVAIGVEPDSQGQLTINASRFDTFLANDPNAIRDLFVAQGSSANNSLQFLNNGLNTVSGTYSVNITQAATKASLTGTTNLSTGLAANDTVTITDTTTLRQAVVNLTSGLSQNGVLTALNTELSTTYTEKHNLNNPLTASGSPANGSTTLSALGLGVVANDTVSISGTLRSGVSVSGTYSVLDPATDTVSGLLSSIQSIFNQQVSATIDSSGKITLTDTTAGDSQLSIALVANNEGNGSLAFGSDTIVTQGRYSLPVQAVISGNFIALEATSFGTGGFTMNGLGLVNQTASGVDVAGTINGLAATGSGQSLRGTTGSVDGLGLFYTGSVVGAVGSVTLGIGAGAAFDGLLDIYSNPVSGFIQNSIKSDQTIFDSLTKQIDNQTKQMEQQRVMLTRQFTQMQQALASLQQSSGFLTAQANAQRAG